ncbi:hypothetical protein PHLCEN_2v9251 [Hermanssonia centrifuga]|uniref:Cytochrome P450 n=1 Tax=Hermanssonia centrifuga TaxID=98765 RepID=A0A2R6NRC4_9APHY|nr:hypothetical protein PHLCEN_2v9251 [Hermanssonia centrifuga]
MPPGPPGLPLLGNVFELPSKEMWKTFNEWNKRYDRRSAIYADRPRFVMANEVLCGGINLGFMTYGNLWRKYRRALHEIFNIHAVSSFVPMQSRESMLLISTILDDPANWEHHIQRFSASAVLRATYGWSLFGSSSDRDQTLQKIISLNGTLSKAAVPSNYLVNIFPALIYVPRWFPGAEWKRKGLEAHKTFDNLFMGLVDDVCVRVTTSTLCAMVLAMTLYPDVLRLAHDELDSVVGRDRAPTFEDKPNLPYIDAIVKEVLRWRPVIPLGIPRRCTQDDWYHGYRIPKGALMTSFSSVSDLNPCL